MYILLSSYPLEVDQASSLLLLGPGSEWIVLLPEAAAEAIKSRRTSRRRSLGTKAASLRLRSPSELLLEEWIVTRLCSTESVNASTCRVDEGSRCRVLSWDT